MNLILSLIEEIGVIPSIAINNADSVNEIGSILVRDGAPVIAFDYSVSEIQDVLKKAKEADKNLLYGVCNVRSAEEALMAAEAGAKFIILSGFSESICIECNKLGAMVFPFCESPEQVEKLRSMSLSTLCCSSDNQAVIDACGKDIKAALPGENDPGKIGVLLKRKESATIAACLLKISQEDLLKEGFLEFMYKMHKFDFGHFGMNCSTPEEASGLIDKLCSIFSLSKGEIPTAYFANWKIEAPKIKYPGEKGHICMSTNSVFRAMKFLKTREIGFLDETILYDDFGNIKGAFTSSQIGGYAIQICHN